MTIEEKIELDILSCGTEDYFGLYEIIWGINAKFPELKIGEKYRLAESIFVGCWRTRW